MKKCLFYSTAGVVPQSKWVWSYRTSGCCCTEQTNKEVNKEFNKEVTEVELAENTLTATTPFLLTKRKVKIKRSLARNESNEFQSSPERHSTWFNNGQLSAETDINDTMKTSNKKPRPKAGLSIHLLGTLMGYK